MKTRSPYFPIIILCLAILAIVILPACSTWQTSGNYASAKDISDSQPQPTQLTTDAEPPVTQEDSGSSSSIPQDMVAFEGTIFVASDELVTERWKVAGWRIADQPLDTEIQEPPPDCTLYPHLGVENQWVGSCSGYVLIPRDGAQHIDVILLNADGSTSSVQVAPEPNNN